MTIPTYRWEAESQFIGRGDVLKRLEDWWEGSQVEPINLFGRRRVGKSWLFRKLAHGKPAIVLVADNTSPAQQLSKLAEQLEPYLLVKPDIKDLSTLFRVLYEIAKTEKTLIIIDEFPYLLGNTDSEREESLSSVQAVMEIYRDRSKIKLVLCGSAIAQMESLQAPKSPLHGRLTPLELVPLSFPESRDFFEGDDVIDQLTRYSVAGGMPRYLSLLGKGDFNEQLISKVVDPNSPLFNEVPSLLASELKEPGIYYAILAELATNPKDRGSIADAIGKSTNGLTHYFDKLEAIRLLKKKHPVGSDPDSRSTQYECDDGFVRFWFRFIAPFHANLEAGSNASFHVQNYVTPNLADHTSIEFEHVFHRWVRQQYPTAQKVGWWWGKAANVHRVARTRSSEEVDMVGLAARKVIVVGEAKWTNDPLSYDVLTDLIDFKLPALVDAGMRVPPTREIVLTSRAGFRDGLKNAAATMSDVHLITAERLLREVI